MKRMFKWLVKWTTLALILGFVCLFLTYHRLMPLPNPSPNPREAQLLYREVNAACIGAWLEADSEGVGYYYLIDGHPPEDRHPDVREFNQRPSEEERAAVEATLATNKPSVPLVDFYVTNLIANESVVEAQRVLERAIERYGLDREGGYRRVPRRLLHRLAEAYLREAETRNCIAHHAAETCIYPLSGDGIHLEREQGEKALALYEELVKLYPKDMRYRWLMSVTAMALNVEPAHEPLLASSGKSPFPVLKNAGIDAGLYNPETPRSSGGAILEDFNGDGHLDIMLASYLPSDPTLYYENSGDGTFVDRSEESGVASELGVFRLNQADYDNDGDLDVLLVRYAWQGPGRNTLLSNDGDGNFTDVTDIAGLGNSVVRSFESAWADFDNDGWVDLFVANKDGVGSILWRNQGDGTFLDVTTRMGLPYLKELLSASWGDYDNDGDPDLYVSSIAAPNHLFRNEAGNSFTDVTFEAGVGLPLVSFPAWFFDYDNDGNLDIFAGAYWLPFSDEVAGLTGSAPPCGAATSKLYKNTGGGTFRDATEEAGLNVALTAMGGNFGDLDSDGFLDIYLGTGSPSLMHLVPNRFFHNQGGNGFADATFRANVGHLQKGHGIAFGDFDADGDQDLLVNLGGAARVDRFQPALFRNPGNGNRSLEVSLQGTESNRSAIGARITATLTDGTRVHRTVTSGGPFGASPLRQHIGMGGEAGIASLVIKWPSGRQDLLEDLPPGNHLIIEEGGNVRSVEVDGAMMPDELSRANLPP